MQVRAPRDLETAMRVTRAITKQRKASGKTGKQTDMYNTRRRAQRKEKRLKEERVCFCFQGRIKSVAS